jgi:hypothetical protein
MRLFLILSFLFSNSGFASDVFSEFPSEIDPHGRYVFYSHGFIVEGENPTPEHPRWGVYDFPKIKQAMSNSNYKLIAYHRPKDTLPNKFARMLADNVLQLIKSGVDPKNIALVGFSRGGAITILTSNFLANNDIAFIILAGCADYLMSDSELEIYGRVYSIIETSDDLVGSCQPLADRSKGVNSFTEYSISTGKEHGAFYMPLPVWIKPVKKWLEFGQSGVK